VKYSELMFIAVISQLSFRVARKLLVFARCDDHLSVRNLQRYRIAEELTTVIRSERD
jgi:hypothetical protein